MQFLGVPRGLILSALVVFMFATACSTPVGVRSMSPDEAGRKLTENVLSGGSLSAPTIQILNRFNLVKRFESEPAEVISILHRGMATLHESDRLFALAELSFLHAMREDSRPYYISAAVYAYAFLFPKNRGDVPNRIDPRLRTAIDVYNQGIAAVLCSEEGFDYSQDSLSFLTSFGELTVKLNPQELVHGSFRLKDFTRASTLDIRGLRNRYRWPGIGAPMVATLKPLKGVKAPAFSRMPPGMKIPITAILRIENTSEGLQTGRVRGVLTFMTPNQGTTVTIEDSTMPVEYELSTALASSLEGSTIYDIELKGLFSGDFAFLREKSAVGDGLILTEPYRPGRIPVVLVHGTASSPARWAELFNEIVNDTSLWGRYQFWLFTYNTGNPILYSAGQLTGALEKTVNELDPGGKDPHLKKMILIGHSQGGLLVKFAAINSGTKFWDIAFDKTFSELKASPETKELFRRAFFYEPLPMVKRVIFIATPHRGSFIAGGWVGRTVGTFIKLPFRLLRTFQEALTLNPDLAAVQSKDIPRSTQNMDPKSKFIRTLSSIPVDPGITVHSIIAVKNPDDPKENWTDGVVNYESAHIDGVASEHIVHSGHSTQSEPQTIEEIHRILLLHSVAQ